MAIQQRTATGDGTTNNWSALGGGSKYVEVDEAIGAPDDATSYIYKNDATNAVQFFTYTAFAIDSTAITSVVVYFRAQRTAAGANNIRAVIRVTGSSRVGTAQALTTSWANYSETWLTNPATAAAWIESDVEGTGSNPLTEFGVNNTGWAAGEESQCTQVYIEVNYTEAASASAPIPPQIITW